MTIENTQAPEERDITIRNQITELLKDRELSTIEISKIVRITEKSVFGTP